MNSESLLLPSNGCAKCCDPCGFYRNQPEIIVTISGISYMGPSCIITGTFPPPGTSTSPVVYSPIPAGSYTLLPNLTGGTWDGISWILTIAHAMTATQIFYKDQTCTTIDHTNVNTITLSIGLTISGIIDGKCAFTLSVPGSGEDIFTGTGNASDIENASPTYSGMATVSLPP